MQDRESHGVLNREFALILESLIKPRFWTGWPAVSCECVNYSLLQGKNMQAPPSLLLKDLSFTEEMLGNRGKSPARYHGEHPQSPPKCRPNRGLGISSGHTTTHAMEFSLESQLFN